MIMVNCFVHEKAFVKLCEIVKLQKGNEKKDLLGLGHCVSSCDLELMLIVISVWEDGTFFLLSNRGMLFDGFPRLFFHDPTYFRSEFWICGIF